MKRLVLFVEGEGEAKAVPKLVKKLLTEQGAWDAVRLDNEAMRVGEVSKLVKNDCREWKRKLATALRRGSPRGAKEWFRKLIEGGYKPTKDQAALVDLVNLVAIRSSNLRSFKRLENALAELIGAIRANKPVATPSPKGALP